MKKYLTFYECEHDGDLEYYVQDVTESGGQVHESRMLSDETGLVFYTGRVMAPPVDEAPRGEADRDDFGEHLGGLIVAEFSPEAWTKFQDTEALGLGAMGLSYGVVRHLASSQKARPARFMPWGLAEPPPRIRALEGVLGAPKGLCALCDEPVFEKAMIVYQAEDKNKYPYKFQAHRVFHGECVQNRDRWSNWAARVESSDSRHLRLAAAWDDLCT